MRKLNTDNLDATHGIELTPGPLPPDEHYVVEIEYQAEHDEYIATVQHPIDARRLSGAGISMCDALHNIADSIESAGIFHAERYDPDAPLNAPRLRKCQYCKGKFFFVTTVAGKWMPIDGESVPIKDLGGVRGYQLDGLAAGIKLGQVQARPLGWRARGSAWVAHQNVCGATSDGPPSSLLYKRWEKNRGVTQAAIDDAMREIQEALIPRQSS